MLFSLGRKCVSGFLTDRPLGLLSRCAPCCPQPGPSPSPGGKCSLALPEVMRGLRIPQVKPSYLIFQEMLFSAFLRTQHAFVSCSIKHVAEWTERLGLWSSKFLYPEFEFNLPQPRTACVTLGKFRNLSSQIFWGTPSRMHMEMWGGLNKTV